MIYEYKCRLCGSQRESQSHNDVQACSCGGASKRVFSFNSGPSFSPHFNHSVGRYVSSNTDFNDALKQASDAQSLRTGLDHKFVRVDPGDVPAPTQSTEIFETRNKIVRDQKLNLPEVS